MSRVKKKKNFDIKVEIKNRVTDYFFSHIAHVFFFFFFLPPLLLFVVVIEV